ncbi:MAG: GIY-YIG nuclease family protein [Candidatus Magasanikbacteria bacterium]|nr:GIY-YIG nuclease family protein [Candidatus Magasanikbacteria bacterium]
MYFLKSSRNSKIYCGFSDKDPKERLLEHNQGSNKWTRQNGPFLLVYYESYHCETDARSRELFYKSGFGRKIRDAILSSVSARG